MKAIVYSDNGSPEVLKYEEVEKPSPTDDEVLIKVRSASLNPADWRVAFASPFLRRILLKAGKNKVGRPGIDVAGVVETVGRNVLQFKPGDNVFGAASGAFAEYACSTESRLAIKPDKVSFEFAGSVTVAALTALQGLRDKGHIQPGHNVLINGAAGGVGTFAVQIAKSFGAHVTGVCSSTNVEMVRSIGADRVIDYTQQDFTKDSQRYDLILDNVGNRSLSACMSMLTPNGMYVMAGGPKSAWSILFRFVHALGWTVLSRRVVMFIAKMNVKDLADIGELMQSGKVTPVIDRRYALSDVPQAFRYAAEGHARGKVVVNL